MKTRKSETINISIRDNEINATDWPLNESARELYWWVDFFNATFFKEEPVPVPAISFEKTRITTQGHYIGGPNAFGVSNSINLNCLYLNRPMWDILVSLLHEMVHSWQFAYGNPSSSWFHNRQYKIKMAGCGIICDDKGRHLHIKDPFIFYLRKHGVMIGPEMLTDNQIRTSDIAQPIGKSKLKKWSCGCTNIRVAVKDLEAKCLKCGGLFNLT